MYKIFKVFCKLHYEVLHRNVQNRLKVYRCTKSILTDILMYSTVMIQVKRLMLTHIISCNIKICNQVKSSTVFMMLC